MAYTYDTTSYTKGFMMLGSSKIRTLESLTDNVKKLTCSEISSHYYDTDRYPISGIPMLAYRMVNGKSALRVVDVQAITGLQGSFGTLTDKTTLNGCSVQVATNGLNDYILHLQKLTDLDYVPMNKSTDYSGMQWLLDEDHSLAIVTTEQQPRAFKKFMFGHKLILCGEYSDGFSPISLIDTDLNITTNNLIISLDAGDINSYPGSGTIWTNLINNTTYTISNGSFDSGNGGSINFNGTSTFVAIGSPLSNNANYSMEAWIRASAVNLSHNIISSANNVFWINNGILYGGVGGSYMLVSKSGFPTNTWKHVALTFNDTTNTMTLYIDGVQVNQNTGVTQSYMAETLRIGSHFFGGNPVSFFNGKIAIARIYNSTLTSAQILQNYNATKSRFI